MLSNAWSWFVIILAIGNILAMFWLLMATSKVETGEEGDTTGHKWDDIEELNNPLPRWWLWLFILTIIFSLVYLYLYPGLGNYKGSLNWTQVGEFQDAREVNTTKQNAYFAEFVDQSIVDLAKNEKAMETGKRLFLNNCATCHGSAGQGAKGFPNLSDNDWLYGNEPDTILASITNGRAGIMPNLGLTKRNLAILPHYLRHISGLEEANEYVVKEGKAMFAVCAACHGADGAGNQALGAPNLTDSIWLHGSSVSEIETILANGKQGNMPSFKQLLTENEIKILAAYVLSMGDS